MLKVNEANAVWTRLLSDLLVDPEYVVAPRKLKVNEVINAHYSIAMPAFVDVLARKVNVGFMLAEAAWVIAGSNRLSDLTAHIKGYAKFSDDGVFMKGAYGPKVIDQLPYIVDTLSKDKETRQAVLTVWRERPGQSKDIPCTIAAQFFIRGGFLHSVFTMRSQDVVLGYTYDVFTFSMITEAVRRLYLEVTKKRLRLGMLHVNVGSLHLYEDYYERADQWATDHWLVDPDVEERVDRVLTNRPETYTNLVDQLIMESNRVKKTV